MNGGKGRKGMEGMSMARAERVRENRMQDDIDERFGRQERFEEAVEAKTAEILASSTQEFGELLNDWIDDPAEILSEVFYECGRVIAVSPDWPDYADLGTRVLRRFFRTVDAIAEQEAAQE
jgi:hypothetical protein